MMNSHDRIPGGYGRSYAAAVDAELRLGWGYGDIQIRPPFPGHVCSYCSRSFASLQALGGHQTAHRKEIEQMRRQHQAIMTMPSAANAMMLRLGRAAGDRAEGRLAANLRSLGRQKKLLAQDEARVPIDLELTLATGGLDLTLRL